MHACVARQLDHYKVCLLVLVSNALPNLVTHTTFQNELLLSPLTLREILEFDIPI